MTHPEEARYRGMPMRRLGRWGLKLPVISLGLWQNFSSFSDEALCKKIVFEAFDHGITHFDLANNYGSPYGFAEEMFGRIGKHLPRHEIVVSSKAGFDMWDGPYGDGGSRKYLLESLDQSLRRLQLDRLDIFYHHRPDPETPMDESLSALEQAVRSGKAIYAGISNYNAEQTRGAADYARNLSFPLIVNQSKYNILQRDMDPALFKTASELGLGLIAFSPLAQGLLTNKYLEGIPEGSRASRDGEDFRRADVSEGVRAKVRTLDSIARRRGQTIAQLALSWVLQRRAEGAVTSTLVGVRSLEQLHANIEAASAAPLSGEELGEIEEAVNRALS